MTEPDIDIEKIALDLIRALNESAIRSKYRAEGVQLLYDHIVKAANNSERQRKPQTSDVSGRETQAESETQQKE